MEPEKCKRYSATVCVSKPDDQASNQAGTSADMHRATIHFEASMLCDHMTVQQHPNNRHTKAQAAATQRQEKSSGLDYAIGYNSPTHQPCQNLHNACHGKCCQANGGNVGKPYIMRLEAHAQTHSRACAILSHRPPLTCTSSSWLPDTETYPDPLPMPKWQYPACHGSRTWSIKQCKSVN